MRLPKLFIDTTKRSPVENHEKNGHLPSLAQISSQKSKNGTIHLSRNCFGKQDLAAVTLSMKHCTSKKKLAISETSAKRCSQREKNPSLALVPLTWHPQTSTPPARRLPSFFSDLRQRRVPIVTCPSFFCKYYRANRSLAILESHNVQSTLQLPPEDHRPASPRQLYRVSTFLARNDHKVLYREDSSRVPLHLAPQAKSANENREQQPSSPRSSEFLLQPLGHWRLLQIHTQKGCSCSHYCVRNYQLPLSLPVLPPISSRLPPFASAAPNLPAPPPSPSSKDEDCLYVRGVRHRHWRLWERDMNCWIRSKLETLQNTALTEPLSTVPVTLPQMCASPTDKQSKYVSGKGSLKTSHEEDNAPKSPPHLKESCLPSFVFDPPLKFQSIRSRLPGYRYLKDVLHVPFQDIGKEAADKNLFSEKDLMMKHISTTPEMISSDLRTGKDLSLEPKTSSSIASPKEKKKVQIINMELNLPQPTSMTLGTLKEYQYLAAVTLGMLRRRKLQFRRTIPNISPQRLAQIIFESQDGPMELLSKSAKLYNKYRCVLSKRYRRLKPEDLFVLDLSSVRGHAENALGDTQPLARHARRCNLLLPDQRHRPTLKDPRRSKSLIEIKTNHSRESSVHRSASEYIPAKKSSRLSDEQLSIALADWEVKEAVKKLSMPERSLFNLGVEKTNAPSIVSVITIEVPLQFQEVKIQAKSPSDAIAEMKALPTYQSTKVEQKQQGLNSDIKEVQEQYEPEMLSFNFGTHISDLPAGKDVHLNLLDKSNILASSVSTELCDLQGPKDDSGLSPSIYYMGRTKKSEATKQPSIFHSTDTKVVSKTDALISSQTKNKHSSKSEMKRFVDFKLQGKGKLLSGRSPRRVSTVTTPSPGERHRLPGYSRRSPVRDYIFGTESPFHRTMYQPVPMGKASTSVESLTDKIVQMAEPFDTASTVASLTAESEYDVVKSSSCRLDPIMRSAFSEIRLTKSLSSLKVWDHRDVPHFSVSQPTVTRKITDVKSPSDVHDEVMENYGLETAAGTLPTVSKTLEEYPEDQRSRRENIIFRLHKARRLLLWRKRVLKSAPSKETSMSKVLLTHGLLDQPLTSVAETEFAGKPDLHSSEELGSQEKKMGMPSTLTPQKSLIIHGANYPNMLASVESVQFQYSSISLTKSIAKSPRQIPTIRYADDDEKKPMEGQADEMHRVSEQTATDTQKPFWSYKRKRSSAPKYLSQNRRAYNRRKAKRKPGTRRIQKKEEALAKRHLSETRRQFLNFYEKTNTLPRVLVEPACPSRGSLLSVSMLGSVSSCVLSSASSDFMIHLDEFHQFPYSKTDSCLHPFYRPSQTESFSKISRMQEFIDGSKAAKTEFPSRGLSSWERQIVLDRAELRKRRLQFRLRKRRGRYFDSVISITDDRELEQLWSLSDDTRTEKDDFLSRYCIIKGSGMKIYQDVFQSVDKANFGLLTTLETLKALRQVSKALKTNLTPDDEVYLLRIMEMVGYDIVYGTDFRLFCILAALTERIAALDTPMRQTLRDMSMMVMENQIYRCRSLWECSMDEESKSISLDQMAIELKAGGVKDKHVMQVRKAFEQRGALDILDFVTYVPLFLMIHKSVVENPLDDSRKK